MVHSAYDSLQLFKDCPTKIDAVESYGSTLLVACSDGSLRIYGPESSPPSDRHSETLELKREPYVLERTVNGFSRRPMLAMEVLGSRELLLSLSESISFHKLPNLETLAVITKAKGANAYSWDDRRGFLCFARQKRVCIFRQKEIFDFLWLHTMIRGRGFVEVKEFGVPDTVKSMSWCGENICLGIRRDYTILNATNGALTEDNIGVLVDQNGKLLQEGRICWSEAPISVVIQKPYAMALLPRHIEIRSLRVPYPLIQTVVLRDVRHIHQGNNAVIVALNNSIYGLFPVPLGAQIVQLTASGNFEEALALCKLLPPEDSSLRASKEQSIHIRYAHYLFENGSYEDAMEHFGASQVEITYVLSLYPSIVIPKSSVAAEPDKFVDVTGEAYLSRASSGLSDDLDSSTSHLLEYDESSALESKKMSHNTLMALVKFLQKKRSFIIGKAAAERTEEVVSDAVGHTFVSYESGRSKRSSKGRVNIPLDSGAKEMAAILDTALLQALLLTGQAAAALDLLKGLNYCDVKISEEILRNGNHYVGLLELYKCNSLHREALKLLHQLVEESKSDEPKLELTQKFKPEMIIEYLKPLCGIDPMLVLEFSMLVLESCPTQTIDLFLSGYIPGVDALNERKWDLWEPAKRNGIMTDAKVEVEHNAIIAKPNERDKKESSIKKAVQIYLSEVLEWYADLTVQKKWDEKTYTSTRKKLLSALEGISGYSPEVLLKRLPTNALFEERAILLGKMNQHELALSIYVHKLHVPDLALSYCDRVYEAGLHQQPAKATGNIYLTLLQIYLNPNKTTRDIEKRINNLVSSPPGSASKGKSDGDADDPSEEGTSNIMLDEVLDVLSQRWDRVNGAQALKLLPNETKLQNLVPFLGPLLRKTSEAHRNFSVITRLRESQNLQTKDELYSQRKTVVKITADSMCSLCNKKIGTSVFAVYPNGNTIVHFVCFRDSQKMKASGKSSSLRRR
ncbi:hypothetical protein OSB04_000606 [Centaurea solstitialis]|uniref:CNH domain-containing protein n=1 Tax=Centaurea solstitialis TaxID=347529 RepID=A0AA38U154_9ASTR|nr:hypothetical protein OSB04_000606 [Centaurea solstitialis]